MLQAVDFSLEPLPKDAYKRRHRQLTEKLVVLQQEDLYVYLFASRISCITWTRAPPACT